MVGTRAYVSKNLAYRKHPIDGLAQFYDHVRPSEVPSMATFIVGIFVDIIVGAASAFVYLVLADDSGRTGPQSAFDTRNGASPKCTVVRSAKANGPGGQNAEGLLNAEP